MKFYSGINPTVTVISDFQHFFLLSPFFLNARRVDVVDSFRRLVDVLYIERLCTALVYVCLCLCAVCAKQNLVQKRTHSKAKDSCISQSFDRDFFY